MKESRVFIKEGKGWDINPCPTTDTVFKLLRNSPLEGTLQIWDKEQLLDSWNLTTDEQKSLFYLLSRPADENPK